MRFLHNLTLAALVAIATAQTNDGGNNNPFNTPSGGYQITLGQPVSLSWSPTAGSTVTLQLQWGVESEANQGIVIASGISNTGSYEWDVPKTLPTEPNFFFKITDDQDTTLFDYSARFSISGASGSATPTASTASSSAVSSTSATSSSSSSPTPSSSSASSSSSATSSSSSSASSSTSTSASSSSTAASTTTASPTPSSTPTSTAAPHDNSGTANAPSALMAFLLALVALL